MGYMAQVTIYLPQDLETRLRRDAKRAGKSLSAFIAELADRRPEPEGWQDRLDALYGTWEGDFPTPEDPPADEPDAL